MPLLILLLLLFGVILIANSLVSANNARFNQLFDLALLLLQLPLFLIGIAFLLITPDNGGAFPGTEQFPLDNLPALGFILMGIAIWSVLVSRPRFRQSLSRWLPINPNSAVHSLALIMGAYLVANTALTLSQGGLQELAVSAESASINDVVLQQALFVVLALFGVGLLVRRNGHSLSTRLGLERVTRAQLWLALRWIVILVFVQWMIGGIWALTNPEQSDLLNGVNDQLLGDFDTVGEWFILALTAGLGEELLFRGALQPVFGLWPTSILFAVAHVQYGLTLVTVAVFIIGAVLGYIRQRTNTSVAILVHFGYNFVLGLFSLLAVYLEQFIS